MAALTVPSLKGITLIFSQLNGVFLNSSFFQGKLTKDVDNSINPLCHVLSIVKGSHEIFWAQKMSDVTTGSEINRRDELREKVRALEEESSQLENEIVWLKGKLELIELDRRSTSLTDKIGTLQVQKTLLEEKLSHVTEKDTDAPSSPSPSESTSEFQEMSTILAETNVVTEIESAVPQEELGVSGPVENTLTPKAQQETIVPVVLASTSTTEPISENQSSSPQ